MKGEGGLEHHFVFDFTMLFFFFFNTQCMLSPYEYKYTGIGTCTYINNYYLYSHAFQEILAFMLWCTASFGLLPLLGLRWSERQDMNLPRLQLLTPALGLKEDPGESWSSPVRHKHLALPQAKQKTLGCVSRGVEYCLWRPFCNLLLVKADSAYLQADTLPDSILWELPFHSTGAEYTNNK